MSIATSNGPDEISSRYSLAHEDGSRGRATEVELERLNQQWPAVSCAVCQEDLMARPLALEDLSELAACARCGHLQLSCAPPSEVISELFGTPYWGASQPRSDDGRFRGDAHSSADLDRSAALERLARDLPESRSAQVLMDLRAGSGALVRSARDRGMFADGCEPDARLREAARRDHQVELWSTQPEDVELAPGSLGAAIAYRLFDHVIDPAPVLDKIHALLFRGGHLVVGCNTIYSFGAAHAPKERHFGALDVAHLYDGYDLAALIERHHFKMIDLHWPTEDTVVVTAEAISGFEPSA